MELCNSEMEVTHCDLSRAVCRRRAMKKSRASTKSSAAVAAIASLLFCSFLLQPAAAAARESSKGYDGDLTLFSPEGRLYQVEYVMKAVGHYGCPAVGVHGDDCCVVACKRDLPDELVYPDSVSSIFRISDEIYSAATGMRGDVLYQVKRAQLQAVEYKRQYGSPMPSRLLTLAMADAAQVKTQHAALRPMACVCFVISVDDPAGPTLFRVEPSGQAFQAWGTAAGRGSAASLEFLEETLDRAREREQNKAGTSTPDEENKKTPDEFTSGHSEVAGGASSTEGGGGGSAAEENGAGTGGSLSQDSASSSLSEDSASSALSEDSASGEGRGGGGGGAEGEVGAGVGKPELSSGGRVPRVGWTAGFGVVGVEGTVELALQALSKASSGKDSPPLTDKNVEIAIASRDSGIRVCSRKEVRGFLGKMKLSSTDCVPAGGR